MIWVRYSIARLNHLYKYVGVVPRAYPQRQEGNHGGLPLQELHN